MTTPRRLHRYRYELRRQTDGVATFVSSHQPPTQWKAKTLADLQRAKADILSMPHWQKFLQGSDATLVVKHYSTTDMVAPGMANAMSLMKADPEIIEI